MNNPLPPMALSPAALGALQTTAAAAKPAAQLEQETRPKPVTARDDPSPRRGQYLDIVV